jgi:hypothetical protein
MGILGFNTYASLLSDFVQAVLQFVALGLVEVVGAEGEVGIQLEASQGKLDRFLLGILIAIGFILSGVFLPSGRTGR